MFNGIHKGEFISYRRLCDDDVFAWYDVDGKRKAATFCGESILSRHDNDDAVFTFGSVSFPSFTRILSFFFALNLMGNFNCYYISARPF